MTDPQHPPADARIRLFCFPHAGAGSGVYRAWTAALAPDIDVRPVELPGRDGRYAEPPRTSVTALARGCADELAAVMEQAADDLPYALFGHSLGAVAAYETARALLRRGRPPAMLVVSGSEPPHRLTAPARPCHGLPDDAFLAEVIRLGGTSPEIREERELLRLMLPALRADFTAAETYRHRPGGLPLPTPIAVYAGSEDMTLVPRHLDDWGQLTRVPVVRHRRFPGDHFYLDAGRPLVLQALRHDLLQAAAQRPVPPRTPTAHLSRRPL
ncbi:thioesterase II family protein [Streptomyces sp. NRRL S-1022]|uniref:thioesterase II family protein n=1 Tax=Streptomyces sp. NRRL S-1022 TaxID=1463880 RepID=UPI0004BF46C5|nr:thioesterase domain-containing protein [Streptomyces sp. NRRL S-1022]